MIDFDVTVQYIAALFPGVALQHIDVLSMLYLQHGVATYVRPRCYCPVHRCFISVVLLSSTSMLYCVEMI